MKRIWDRKGLFQASEQRIADQAKQIRVNGWLTDIEIEEIRRRCEATDEQEEHENEEVEHVEKNAEVHETDNSNSFPEDDEIMLHGTQVERFDDEKKSY